MDWRNNSMDSIDKKFVIRLYDLREDITASDIEDLFSDICDMWSAVTVEEKED